MSSPIPTSRARRWLRRFTATTTAGGVLLFGAPMAAQLDPAAPGPYDAGLALVSARLDDAVPPGRRVRGYTVRSGDTATGLAVRYHAWTAELLELNGLTSDAVLQVGQRIRIPVVVAAVRKERKPPAKGSPRTHDTGAGPSRAEVRRVIVRTARRYDVGPRLALAVSWQESGWQMHHVSSANAIGAMQVLPATGTWMSLYAGRPLNLRRLGDNVTAGVLLLDLLRSQAPRRRAIAGYYQGLAGVREHGMYDDTKAYVRNVLALRSSLREGWNPA